LKLLWHRNVQQTCAHHGTSAASRETTPSIN
jgi:hypothetical protein